jgi:hypothetical protein
MGTAYEIRTGNRLGNSRGCDRAQSHGFRENGNSGDWVCLKCRPERIASAPSGIRFASVSILATGQSQFGDTQEPEKGTVLPAG